MKIRPTQRLAWITARAVRGFLCLLPLRVCFGIGYCLGDVARLLDFRHRRLVRDNMEIAFGGELSSRELDRMAARHYRLLGANLLSGIRISQMNQEEIMKFVDLGDLPASLRSATAGGRGVILALMHFGNWEVFAQISMLLADISFATIYQRLGNPLLDAEIRKGRERFGVKTFDRREGFHEPIRLLRGGGVLGMLVDQHAGDGGVWTPFFGRIASTSPLAAMTALRTDATILPAAARTVGWARWRIELGPLLSPDSDNTGTLTARLNRSVESIIRTHPPDWFWVHNRWRTPRPAFLLQHYKRGVTPPPDASVLKPFRIAIRSSNWLGDAVMTLPAVRTIKAGRPDAHVTVVVQKKLGDFWRAVPWVDEVLEIPPRNGLFSVVSQIRSRRFDVGIVFPNSLRSALEMWLGGVPRRVGYAGHARSRLLNQIVPVRKKPGPPEHQVHHYLRIAKHIGAESTDLSPLLRPLRPAAPSSDVSGPIEVGLCPGAEYGPAKRWTAERFAEAARQVTARREVRWILFGTAKEAELASDIAACLDGQCENLSGKTTLGELMDRLGRCRALLTNDTGTMHLATTLGVPVVALFGSTEPRLTGPLGEGHRVIRHPVECSPCFLRKCPLDFRCMNAISVEEVVESVVRCLDGE